MAVSPSPLNYFVGKGTLVFTEDGGSPRDLGNAPTFKTTPSFEFLDHHSSRTGVKEKDDSTLVSKAGTVDITLDEITLENLSIALFGGAINTDREFEIFAVSAKKGSLLFTGTNDKGNQFKVVVNSVSFRPTEGVDFISEEHGIITLVGEMLSVDGVFGSVQEIAEGTI